MHAMSCALLWIRALAVWLQKVDPKNDGAARDWVAIYDECSRILYQEIDYRGEAANAQQFADNFKGQDWIKVSIYSLQAIWCACQYCSMGWASGVGGWVGMYGHAVQIKPAMQSALQR